MSGHAYVHMSEHIPKHMSEHTSGYMSEHTPNLNTCLNTCPENTARLPQPAPELKDVCSLRRPYDRPTRNARYSGRLVYDLCACSGEKFDDVLPSAVGVLTGSPITEQHLRIDASE